MYSEIISSLETKLNAFAIANNYDVSWPGVSFEPAGAYLEAFLLPAETGTGGLKAGSFEDYRGIYQINVVTPMGGGTADMRAMIDSVLSEFAKATKAGDVLIEKSWVSGNIDRNQSFVVSPISVQYRLIK